MEVGRLKWILACLALIGVVLICCLAWRPKQREHAASVDSSLPPIRDDPQALVAAEREPIPATSKSNGDRGSDHVVDPALGGNTPTPAAPPEDPFWISGAVDVVDSTGTVHSGESGELDLRLTQASKTTPIHFTVTNGWFNVQVPTDGELSVHTATMGEHRALAPDRSTRWTIVRNQQLRLTLRWPGPNIVHVKDASTGDELFGARAWIGFPRADCGDLVPSTSRGGLLSWGGPVPMVLDFDHTCKWVDSHCVFVSAEGFAWARFECDFTRAAEITVSLEPACSLRVEIDGSVPWESCELALVCAQQEGRRLEKYVRRSTQFEIGRLPPGDYVAELRCRAPNGGDASVLTKKVKLQPEFAAGLLMDGTR